jgi:ferredoxin-NADP reductase
LAAREAIASGTWAFTLGLGNTPLAYRPGQTIDLILPKPIHEDVAGNRRTFSIASAPGRDTILIATRLRGSGFKRSLIDMPLRSTLEMEGPFGSFTLPGRPSSVVMLAGGIGVTPFRAMVEEVVTRPLGHAVLLVHSNRTPEETPFLVDLEHWNAANPGFTYRATMTGMARSHVPWTGDRSRVSSDYLSKILPKGPDPSLYYVAGPEGFVRAAIEAVKDLGIDEDRIRFEEFAGY